MLFLQVGDDSFGERYIENFKRNGVNTGISYVILKIFIFFCHFHMLMEQDMPHIEASMQPTKFCHVMFYRNGLN